MRRFLCSSHQLCTEVKHVCSPKTHQTKSESPGHDSGHPEVNIPRRSLLVFRFIFKTVKPDVLEVHSVLQTVAGVRPVETRIKKGNSHLNSQDRNAVFSSINFSLSDCFFSLFVVLFFFFLFTVLPICERVEARHRNKRCRYDDVSKSIESTKTNSSLLHLKLILDRCEVKDGKSELKPAHWTPS